LGEDVIFCKLIRDGALVPCRRGLFHHPLTV